MLFGLLIVLCCLRFVCLLFWVLFVDFWCVCFIRVFLWLELVAFFVVWLFPCTCLLLSLVLLWFNWFGVWLLVFCVYLVGYGCFIILRSLFWSVVCLLFGLRVSFLLCLCVWFVFACWLFGLFIVWFFVGLFCWGGGFLSGLMVLWCFIFVVVDFICCYCVCSLLLLAVVLFYVWYCLFVCWFRLLSFIIYLILWV